MPSLIPDSFANPQLWPLFLIALLPIILYLLDRRSARRVEWPAVRFFLVRRAARVRWIRMRELLLIGVRTLLILAIVYAFLRPLHHVTSTLAGGADTATRPPRAFVLVVDTSSSMALEHGAPARSSLARARDGLREVLRIARPGDTLALHVGDAILRRAEVKNGSLEEVSEAVRTAVAAGHAFDLSAAIDRALANANELKESLVDVFVFTDLQPPPTEEVSTSWEFLSARWSTEASTNQDTRLTIVDCGAESAVNAHVVAIRTAEALVGTDAPTRIEIEADVPAPIETARWTMRLLIDDEPVFAREIEASESSRVSLAHDHEFPRAGLYRLEAQLISLANGDGLRLDDRHFAVLEAHERVDVVLRGGREGALDSRHYLELALFPRSRNLRPDDVLFRPRSVDALSADSIGEARVVVLADISSLAPDEWTALETFVRTGGGLLTIVGESASADSLNGASGDRRPVLPARLGARIELEGQGYALEPVDLSHPALAVFGKPEQGDLGRVRVRSFTRIEELAPDARSLVRIGPSNPWLVEGSLGLGRSILLLTSTTPADSDLPRTPLFLPLVHSVARHLASGDRSEQSVSSDSGLHGRDLHFRLRSARSSDVVRATSPRGESRRLTVAVGAGGHQTIWRRAREIGIYRVEETASESESQETLAAVNMSTSESRLERFPSEVLELVRKLTPSTRLVTEVDVSESDDRTRVELREAWPVVLALALLLVVLELALHSSIARGRLIESGGTRS